MFQKRLRNWYPTILLIILIAFSSCIPVYAAPAANTEKDDPAMSEEPIQIEEIYLTGRVVEIVKEEEMNNPFGATGGDQYMMQFVRVKLDDAPFKGQTRVIENTVNLTNASQGTYRLSVGERVIVYANLTKEGAIKEAYIQDLDRHQPLLLLFILFAGTLIVFGRMRGVAALISLTAIGLLIWYWLIPHIIKGGSPMWGSVFICCLVAVFSIPLVHGLNLKSFAAIIGTLTGVTLAGILAYFAGTQARLMGIEFEYANLLSALPRDIPFDLRGIYLAGVLIGGLGAVMDTSISVASAIQEFIQLNPKITPRQLWKTGMNVGKDVMSMMSSTLILAYTGGALPLMLLLTAYQTPALKILNSDMLASEIVRSLAGSIGLSLCIPITILAAIILNRPVRRRRRDRSV